MLFKRHSYAYDLYTKKKSSLTELFKCTFELDKAKRLLKMY